MAANTKTSAIKDSMKAVPKAADKVADKVKVKETAPETAPVTTAEGTDAQTPVTATTDGATDVATNTAFDWDALPAATVAVYARTTSGPDLETTTPAFIKGRVASAFEATEKAGSNAKGPIWMMQNCGSPERAEEFLKMARKYATFKDYTLRGEANPIKIMLEDGTSIPGEGIVKFAVKPRETRKRTPKPVPAEVPAEVPVEAS